MNVKGFVMRHSLRLVFFIFVSMFSLQAHTGSVLHDYAGDGAKLFDSTYKTLDRYKLITREIIYQDEDSNEFTKGYRPVDILDLEVPVRREIFDYSGEATALSVYRNITVALFNDGYSSEFRCEHDACGDVEGWALHLTNLIYGDVEHQYYGVFKKKTSTGKDIYVAAYINEADRQPRMVIDRVGFDHASTTGSIVKGRAELVGLLSDATGLEVAPILFDIASTNPLAGYERSLSDVAGYIKANTDYQYAVVGYADTTGAAAANFNLSQKRAEFIRSLLIVEYGVDPELLQSYGFGERSSGYPGSPVEKAGNNRRVMFYQLTAD